MSRSKNTHKCQNKKKNINLKIYSRYRNLFKYNKTSVNPNFLLLRQKFPKYGFILKATQNNIFCTLINHRSNKIIFNTSAGKEKLKISRKTLIFGAKNIFLSFFKKIKKQVWEASIYVNIIGPLRIKLIFLRMLRNYSKKSCLLINTQHKKCFNGCKVKKKKRKKQRGLRVFKS